MLNYIKIEDTILHYQDQKDHIKKKVRIKNEPSKTFK